jgi:hypothetical protein
MRAELGRKERGERTRTGMDKSQLRDFARTTKRQMARTGRKMRRSMRRR